MNTMNSPTLSYLQSLESVAHKVAPRNRPAVFHEHIERLTQMLTSSPPKARKRIRRVLNIISSTEHHLPDDRQRSHSIFTSAGAGLPTLGKHR